MAVLYLSLHLAVFTGLARINQLMWRMERGRIRNSQRKNCSSVFVRSQLSDVVGRGEVICVITTCATYLTHSLDRQCQHAFTTWHP